MMNPNPGWLGLVVAPPQIGSPLVIGKPGARDVTLTSTVIRVFSRDDGTLVQTEGGSRYFVGIAGNTYRVQHVSEQPEQVSELTGVDLAIDSAVQHSALRAQGPLPAPLPRSRAPRASTIRARQPERAIDEDAVTPGDDVTVLLLKQARNAS